MSASTLATSLTPKSPPSFGHGMLQHFSFNPEYLNFNHGSYGSLPKPVGEAYKKLVDQAESNPDLFHRIDYEPILVDVRKQLAKFIGVKDHDEVVLVQNTSNGLNTVLRNFIWSKEDLIITCTTTYNSISRTAQYLNDIPPHPTSTQFTITFPDTRKNIIENWRKFLQNIKTEGRHSNGKIVAIIDSIISHPGCALPWKDMVAIAKECNVVTVIDAAHSIGQEPDINLDEVQPDYWSSNCHKWLFVKRSCAVLYVPKRNQKNILATFPTSYAYVSPANRDYPWQSFVQQFEWNGTIDFPAYLSVPAAIKFRESIGGEKAINEYCHNLAIEGGKRLAASLGTSVLDPQGEFTMHMTDVALPFPEGFTASDEVRVLLTKKLLVQRSAFGSPHYHNNKWWIRLSAQIWIELEDFDKIAVVLKEVCKNVEQEMTTSSKL